MSNDLIGGFPEATVGPRGMRDIMGVVQQAADPAEALLTQAAPTTARPA